MRKITTRLAAAAIVLGASSLVAPAYAADDIDSNPITEFFAGIGLSKKEKPDIDYQERAPLVPPTSTASLPPPVDKGAAGRDTGLWPNDPDVERRAKARAEADRLPTETNSYRIDRNSRLDPSEIGRKRTAGASVNREPGSTNFDNDVTRVSPADLRSHRAKTADASPAAVGPEPERKRLSDPPSGYLAGNGAVGEAPPEEKKSWLGKLFSH